MTDITNTKLAADLSAVVNRWNTRENQMIDFISKPSGMVIVTDGVNVDHVLPSFPQLQANVNVLTDDLTGAVAQAQDINSVSVSLLNQTNAGVATIDASLAAANTAATAAEASASTASTKAGEAQTFRNQANTHKNAAASSATTANTHASTAASKADAAASSADAAAGSASAAATSAAEAKAAASTASTKAGESATYRNQSQTYRNQAQTHASTASTKATEAAQSATEAEGFKSDAATSAGQANSHKTTAAASASTATEQADIASGAMEIATDAADIAVTERSAAQAAAVTAQQHAARAGEWANHAPNVAVDNGEYSARHWAQQAQTTAASAMKYKGEWSAASDQFPANPGMGDLYMVSAAGTVAGVSFAIGDQIVRNSSNTAWVKIENIQSVTSVAGKTGAVVLAAGDIKSGTLNAARIPALPVSKVTGLQTALDGKAAGAHLHDMADLPGLQPALNNKLNLTGGTLTGNLAVQGSYVSRGSAAFNPALYLRNGDNQTRGLLFWNRGNTALTLRRYNPDSGQTQGEFNITNTGNFTFSGTLTAASAVFLKATPTGHAALWLRDDSNTNRAALNWNRDLDAVQLQRRNADGGVQGELRIKSDGSVHIYGGPVTAPGFNGKASSADKLHTSPTINGTSFNGTANIITSRWGAERTLKIGTTGKTVNGAGNVTWTLAEIGAAAASHAHAWNEITGKPAQATRWPKWGEVSEKPALDYLPISGGTLTGQLYVNAGGHESMLLMQRPPGQRSVHLTTDSYGNTGLYATGAHWLLRIDGADNVAHFHSNVHAAGKRLVAGDDGIHTLRKLSQDAYNALNPKDPNTVYIII